MDDSSVYIKVCPYVRNLIQIREDLLCGMTALTQLSKIYDEDDMTFLADDFFETRDLLAKMNSWVSSEILTIIANRTARAVKEYLDSITVHKQSEQE